MLPTGARWPRFGASGWLYYWYSSHGGIQRIKHHAGGDRFVVDGVESALRGSPEEISAFARRVLKKIAVNPLNWVYSHQLATGEEVWTPLTDESRRDEGA